MITGAAAGAALYGLGISGCRDITRSGGEALAASGGSLSHLPQLPADAPLAVARKALDPASAVKFALDSLGGMKQFVSKGDVVIVKPNIGWDRPVQMGADTHPDVVAELVKMALDSGAKKVKVFDHPCNDARRTYKSSGIAKAASDAGADVIFLEDRSLIQVQVPNAVHLKSVQIHREAFESDVIINVPVAKHHGLTRLTLGFKNQMGFLGPDRSRLHQNMGDDLVDLAFLIRPDLTIMDAWRVVVSNGPQGGSMADVKEPHVLAASIDPVAADSFAATLFGLKGEDISYVAAAAKRGLGRIDLGKVKIIET